ncbi:MAG: hypothetical protein COT14_02745 [Candidatus Diapherotrites archaeon CG08_land_8_20_14_0_20_30_16]|nr:MAG: hypothetical protein COT14_02745 [Candidatus Diapherotrites archaeon CG08_land_8_20_14_0_20_30_16]
MVTRYKPKQIYLKHGNLVKQSRAMAIVARHSINAGFNLDLNGRRQAFWAGSKLPSGFEIISAGSKFDRTLETIDYATQGYDSAKTGRTTKGIADERLKKGQLTDAEKAELQTRNRINEILSALDARKPIQELKKLGQQLLKFMITEIAKSVKQQRKPLGLYVTHEGAEIAIFSALGIIKEKEDIEKIFGKRKPTKLVKDAGPNLTHTEGILFYFLQNGRIIMSFRKKKFDITRFIENNINY